MRRLVLLALDLILVVLATLFSLVLRENFDVSASRFLDFLPYLAATFASAAFFLLGSVLIEPSGDMPAGQITCASLAASVAVVFGAVTLTFAYDRLDGVARSLPVLQLLACQAFLIGARILHKMTHDARQHRKASAAFLQLVDKEPEATILIVGISKLTETYLQAIAELAPGCIKIAGLVGQTDRHVGRLVATQPCFGCA